MNTQSSYLSLLLKDIPILVPLSYATKHRVPTENSVKGSAQKKGVENFSLRSEY